MSNSVHAAADIAAIPMAHTPHTKAHTHLAAAKEHGLNPAKQAKAAEPAAKGAEFGALVSQFAHAKHATPPSAPAPTAKASVETSPQSILDIVV